MNQRGLYPKCAQKVRALLSDIVIGASLDLDQHEEKTHHINTQPHFQLFTEH